MRETDERTAAAPGKRLNSWKEIAAYLQRDVRTVQRWEKNESLPVHRKPHDRLASVYAYEAELDAWWNKGSHPWSRVPLVLMGLERGGPFVQAGLGTESLLRNRPPMVCRLPANCGTHRRIFR